MDIWASQETWQLETSQAATLGLAIKALIVENRKELAYILPDSLSSDSQLPPLFLYLWICVGVFVLWCWGMNCDFVHDKQVFCHFTIVSSISLWWFWGVFLLVHLVQSLLSFCLSLPLEKKHLSHVCPPLYFVSRYNLFLFHRLTAGEICLRRHHVFSLIYNWVWWGSELQICELTLEWVKTFGIIEMG